MHISFESYVYKIATLNIKIVKSIVKVIIPEVLSLILKTFHSLHDIFAFQFMKGSITYYVDKQGGGGLPNDYATS